MGHRAVMVFKPSFPTHDGIYAEIVCIVDEPELCRACKDFVPVGCIGIVHYREYEEKGLICPYCNTRRRKMWAQRQGITLKGFSRIEKAIQTELACPEDAPCYAWHLTKEMVYV